MKLPNQTPEDAFHRVLDMRTGSLYGASLPYAYELASELTEFLETVEKYILEIENDPSKVTS